MQFVKPKVTLDESEVELAIKRYIEAYSIPPVKCLGIVKLEKTIYGYKASADIEPEILDPFKVGAKSSLHYRLRHIKTGLYVSSYVKEGDRIKFGVSTSARTWNSIESIFASLKELAKNL